MSPYKPLFVDLSFDYVSSPFPETFATALIPHRVALQTDHQRRTFCRRKGNVVQHMLISGLTFGAWSTSSPWLPLSADSQSVSCSHSVRANIQSVLSLLKQYQPNLCNSHVHHSNDQETGGLRHSDTSTTPIIGEDLSELLQALQEELRLMSLWAKIHEGVLCFEECSFFFHCLHVCLQGAGWVSEAAGGQRVRWGEKRAAEGAGEVAAENGAERRADPQAAQTQKTGRTSHKVHLSSQSCKSTISFWDSEIFFSLFPKVEQVKKGD